MTASDRLTALESMIGNRPDDSRLRFGLALEYLAAGRTEDGVRELRVYLEGADDEGNGWGRLGAVLRDMGRVDEAVEAYRAGIEAADGHGHPTMAEEFRTLLEDMVS